VKKLSLAKKLASRHLSISKENVESLYYRQISQGCAQVAFPPGRACPAKAGSGWDAIFPYS